MKLKESKKFTKFKNSCQWLINRCTTTPEKSDCFEKKCKLFKSKYKDMYYGKTRMSFDSDEELEFYCWLKEAEAHNLIAGINTNPGTFDLSPRKTTRFDKHLKKSIKTVDKFILHPHVYTPDFCFVIESDKIKKLNFFVPNHCKHNDLMIVDVKGGFSKSVDRFSINQKWVMDKHGYYVQKVVVHSIKGKKGKSNKKGLFEKTWVPEICRLSPVKKTPTKKYIGVPTINEFMEGL